MTKESTQLFIFPENVHIQIRSQTNDHFYTSTSVHFTKHLTPVSLNIWKSIYLFILFIFFINKLIYLFIKWFVIYLNK